MGVFINSNDSKNAVDLKLTAFFKVSFMTKVSEFKKTNNLLINKEKSVLKEYNIG